MSAYMEGMVQKPQPNRIGWHLTWPLLSDVLRKARQELDDAIWEGRDARPEAAMVRVLEEQQQRRGVRYVPPF